LDVGLVLTSGQANAERETNWWKREQHNDYLKVLEQKVTVHKEHLNLCAQGGSVHGAWWMYFMVKLGFIWYCIIWNIDGLIRLHHEN
jgi:hypothetical protein